MSSMGDTAPLPAVPPPGAGRPVVRLHGAARALEGVAGLLSAGLVVVAAGLVVLQLIAGDLAPGAGLAAATGPTWLRALAQLAVGAAGEGLVWARRRLSRGARVWGAVVVIVAAAATLWFTWWR